MTPIILLGEVFGKWNGYQWQPAQFCDEDVDTTHIAGAIEKTTLTRDQKQALILRFVYKNNFREIGKRLDVTPGRCRQILHSGIRRLRMPYNLILLKRSIPGWFNYQRYL